MTSDLFQSRSKALDRKATSHGKYVSVEHEWGSLKEVVVGLTDLRVPSEEPASSKNYLPQSFMDFIEKSKGQWLQDFDPELNRQSINQMNSIMSILNNLGVIAHQVE